MPKLTTSVRLNANLQYEYRVIQRNEKGQIQGWKKFILSENTQVRQLQTKVKTVKSISQFESRAKYTLGEKSYQKKVNGFNQLMDNVYIGGSSNKYDAMFMWLMRKLGPDGLDNLYQAYPEDVDKAYRPYEKSNDDERGDKNIIETRQERQTRTRKQNKENILKLIADAGYSEEYIRQDMIRIFIEDNPQLTEEQIQKKLSNPNMPYINYLEKHFFLSFEDMGV